MSVLFGGIFTSPAILPPGQPVSHPAPPLPFPGSKISNKGDARAP